MKPALLYSLLPLLILAAGSVLLMLQIAARRDERLTAASSSLALLLALAACGIAPAADRITALLCFDAYARSLQSLMIAAGLAVNLLLHDYQHRRKTPCAEMHLLLLLAVLGAAVLGGARHAAAVLLGLEIMTIALYGMIATPRTSPRALEALAKYLLLSAAASATLLFGMALLYAASGSLAFAQIAAALAQVPASDARLAGIGAALLIAGLGFKLSLVPFHLWTPDVYSGAPAPVTALLATLSKGAVAAVLLRFLSQVQASTSLLLLLSILAVASILAGNLLALQCGNVKRLLAYSSIAHLGYLMVPILLGGNLAAEALLFYLAAYFATTLGAFGVLGLLPAANGPDAEEIEDFRGLFWRHPGLTSVMTPMLLSLAGIPMTAGFIAKFYVLAVGVSWQAWTLVIAVVAGSAIGLYVYLRLTIMMFQRPSATQQSAAQDLPAPGPGSLATLAASFVLVFWLGLWPQWLLAWLSGIRL